MFVARSLRAVARPTGVRAMSAAPASAVNIDWALIRSKMTTDEGKVETDKARDAFQRRLAAAQAVGQPGEIDWAHYKAKLPDLNVDALKKDYEAFVAAIPAQTYDETADKAAHEAKESAWAGFSKFCESRIAELQELAKEQQEHKLHRFYRRRRVWQRFPGLYESLHHKVRGEWDSELWAQYIQWKGRAVALPWDLSHGDVDADKKKQILSEVADKSGLAPEQVGLEKK